MCGLFKKIGSIDFYVYKQSLQVVSEPLNDTITSKLKMHWLIVAPSLFCSETNGAVNNILKEPTPRDSQLNRRRRK